MSSLAANPNQSYDELHRLARKYCWDMASSDVDKLADKVLLRVMDFGVLDDIVALEDAFGADRLRSALKNATKGALRPRSWSFWHYRLGVLVNSEPPEQPPRISG